MCMYIFGWFYFLPAFSPSHPDMLTKFILPNLPIFFTANGTKFDMKPQSQRVWINEERSNKSSFYHRSMVWCL